MAQGQRGNVRRQEPGGERYRRNALGVSGQATVGRAAIFVPAWGRRPGRRPELSSTHWGAAGKCQLVKLRYSIWLGGRRPGRRATPAKRTGSQRASASWSGYAVQPGWGMAPRQQSTPAPQTTPLPQFFFTKSSRTAGRHSRKGSIPGNKRRQRGGFRLISAENRRRHTGVPAEYTAQENGNSTEK